MKSIGPSHLSVAVGAATRPISRLQTIIEMIESPENGDLSCLLEPFGKQIRHGDEESSETSTSTSTRLKIHVEEELSELWDDHQQVAPMQMKQLIQHVRLRKKALDQREADLQGQVYRWEQQVMGVKAQLKQKTVALEQQLNQLNLQRAQLIKLQQNLIDTQTALREIIERIVDQCEGEELKLQLGKLRFELTETMDAILNRWERLKEILESSSPISE